MASTVEERLALLEHEREILRTLHAYGNSPDDAAMLARAHHAVWV